MNLADLRRSVVNILVTQFDFTIDEAELSVEASSLERSDLWSENADPQDLANFLASEEDDD